MVFYLIYSKTLLFHIFFNYISTQWLNLSFFSVLLLAIERSAPQSKTWITNSFAPFLKKLFYYHIWSVIGDFVIDFEMEISVWVISDFDFAVETKE